MFALNTVIFAKSNAITITIKSHPKPYSIPNHFSDTHDVRISNRIIGLSVSIPGLQTTRINLYRSILREGNVFNEGVELKVLNYISP
jgi:hypothetical protein